ncbi:MAG: cupredoxin domain-containing protein [Actinomycetota bacterium]|nr:cupredoxin domain-containing protein [Actinomycetota bacterium]
MSNPTLAFLICVTLALGACGGQDPAVEPSPTAPATEDPTPTPEPTPTETGGNGAAVDLELEAENLSFQEETLSAPASAQVALEFKNRDSVPHNFGLYTDESAQESIFIGTPITGPDAEETLEFEAPAEPGSYFFRCDIHPDQMTGEFIAE